MRIRGLAAMSLAVAVAGTVLEARGTVETVVPLSAQELKRSWRLPGSPTGKLFSDLLTAVADGNQEAIEKFISERVAPSFFDRMPRDKFAENLAQLHGELGADLEPRGATRTGPNSAKMTVYSPESGVTAEFSIEVEPEEPYRLAGLSLMLSAGDGPGGDAAPFSNFEELDSHLQKRAEEGEFSGVALAAKQGNVQFLKSYGLASKRHQVPNQADTRFNIGSINKIFTAVSILQLFEKGKLDLDDPIGKHLQGFPQDVAQKVTVRHLLQHRAGWGAYWDNPDYLAARPQLRSISQYMEFIRKIPLGFEPGSREEYSNVGYEVLGAVVEAASGVDYYTYVRENVYKPAGMAHSDSFERDWPEPNVATGYTNQNPAGPKTGFNRENTMMFGPKGTPAGGGYSTAEDLFRFGEALRKDELLKPATTDLLLSQYRQDASVDRKGVGVGWAGGAPGVNAMLEMDFGSGETIVVLSNYDPPAAGMVAQGIRSMLRRQSK